MSKKIEPVDISQARSIRITGAVLVMLLLGLFLTVHLEKLTAAPHSKKAITDNSKALTPAGHELVAAKANIGSVSAAYGILKSKDGKIVGYILSNQDLDKGKEGYNGQILLQVRVSAVGVTEDFAIQQNHETPRFLKRVLDQKKIFLGKNIFTPDPAHKPDIVTGATYTSSAISENLYQIGSAFGPALLPQTKPSTTLFVPKKSSNSAFPLAGIALAVALLAAVVLRFWKNGPRHRLIRPAFLLMVFLIFGVGLAMQFSLEAVFAFFTADWSAPGATPAFLLAAVIPLCAILIGNYYCGWLCPFGALQEILHGLYPQRNYPEPGQARYLRYLILLGVIGLFTSFFAAQASAATGADLSGVNCCDALKQKLIGIDLLAGLFPLTQMQGLELGAAAGVLLFTLPTCRFWCRYLCPSGAFLALLGRINLLRRIAGIKHWLRWFPVRPRHCDLGVVHPQDGECFQCDRCRSPSATDSPAITGKNSPVWISRVEALLAIFAAVGILVISVIALLRD